MKTPLPFLLSAGLLSLSAMPGQAQTPPQDYTARLAALRAQVVLAAEGFDKSMAQPNPEPEIRHLACAAFCDLALGADPKKAEGYFRKVMALQNMDEKSPDYGNVAWRINHPEVKDANSIEFTIGFMAPALLRYGKQLSPDFLKEAQVHMKAAIVALRHHTPPVTYGNIYLMKFSNLIMLGEFVGDTSAIEEGKADLDNWLAWTRVYGINEFDSPTYSPVQLADLENVYIHSPDEATKSMAKAGLDYLWSDLAANYFPGRGSLGGPHSRSYDFLFQKGTVQKHFYLEGLSPTLEGKDYLGGVWLNAIQENDYHPSPEILALNKLPDRVIQQRYGIEQGRDRYNHITPDYAIGSISAHYGPQDEQLSVEFASPPDKKLPVSWVVLDNWDAPFGKVTATDKSGHVKPRHLKDVIAAVQDKDRVLALIDLSPDLQHEKTKSVATDIILPMDADAVYLDGEKLPKGKPFERPATADSVVYVREGTAAAAFRIFAADGLSGQKPVFAVKYDGNEWGAGRLVAYHYQGNPMEFTHTPILAGVYLEAAHCANDTEFKDFVQRVRATRIEQTRDGNGNWSAVAHAGSTLLETALDVRGSKIIHRRVNGQDTSSYCLAVNGRDIAAELLGGLKLKAEPPAPKPVAVNP